MDLDDVKNAFREIAKGRLTKLGNPQPRKAHVELALTFIDSLLDAAAAWAGANVLLSTLTDAVVAADLGCCHYKIGGMPFTITATRAEWNMIPTRTTFDQGSPCP
jgi:hypothetical protein